MLGLDIEVSISKLLRKSHTDFHCDCKFAPPPAMRKNSLFLHPRQHQVPLFHISPTGPRKYENFFTSGILLKFFLQYFKVFFKDKSEETLQDISQRNWSYILDLESKNWQMYDRILAINKNKALSFKLE